jgi:DASH complex subunit SPC19
MNAKKTNPHTTRRTRISIPAITTAILSSLRGDVYHGYNQASHDIDNGRLDRNHHTANPPKYEPQLWAMSTMSNSNIATYSESVASLRASLSFLESSVNTLGTGVSDFPRLVQVLKTVRHYELIPQTTLAAAEASLRDDIEPFVSMLLDRGDRVLDRQARRIETLKARADLNAGRLSASDPDSLLKRSASGKRPTARPAGKILDGEKALRAKVVRQKKEALKYSVERLELEVLQKERELRVRLDAA